MFDFRPISELLASEEYISVIPDDLKQELYEQLLGLNAQQLVETLRILAIIVAMRLAEEDGIIYTEFLTTPSYAQPYVKKAFDMFVKSMKKEF